MSMQLLSTNLTMNSSATILTSMTNTTISNTNAKGQIVIPLQIRTLLGITDQVPLQISLRGQIISIEPVVDIVTKSNAVSGYSALLKQTQGSWGEMSASEKTAEQEHRKLELKAASDS
jgi:bifunctional DNA-binding transcriptional regulator/antitoxin component of YhaV-PrlF toxin-antitoxin module